MDQWGGYRTRCRCTKSPKFWALHHLPLPRAYSFYPELLPLGDNPSRFLLASFATKYQIWNRSARLRHPYQNRWWNSTEDFAILWDVPLPIQIKKRIWNRGRERSEVEIGQLLLGLPIRCSLDLHPLLECYCQRQIWEKTSANSSR